MTMTSFWTALLLLSFLPATEALSPDIVWGLNVSQYGSLLGGNGFVESNGRVFVTLSECTLLVLDSTDGSVEGQYDMFTNNTQSTFCDTAPIRTASNETIVFYSRAGHVAAVKNDDFSELFLVQLDGEIAGIDNARPRSMNHVVVAHNVANQTGGGTEGRISYLNAEDGTVDADLSAVVTGERIGPLSNFNGREGTELFEERYFYGITSGNLYYFQGTRNGPPIITNLGQLGRPGIPGGPPVLSPFPTIDSARLYVQTPEPQLESDPFATIFYWNYSFGSSPIIGKERASVAVDERMDGGLLYYESTNGTVGVCYAYGSSTFTCTNSELVSLWARDDLSKFGAASGGGPNLFSSNPSTFGDVVMRNDLRADQSVFGLDIATGNTLWTLNCSNYGDFDALASACGPVTASGRFMALDQSGDNFFFTPLDNWILKADIPTPPPPTPPPTQAPTVSFMPSVVPPATSAPSANPTPVPTDSPPTDNTSGGSSAMSVAMNAIAMLVSMHLVL